LAVLAGLAVWVGPQPLRAQDNTAKVRVIVPADAKVWFGKTATKQSGEMRDFESPSLKPGKEYTYDVKVQWREGDREVTQTQHVDVHANSAATLDFTRPASAANLPYSYAAPGQYLYGDGVPVYRSRSGYYDDQRRGPNRQFDDRRGDERYFQRSPP
jgi:uncharacterized protein (TIGR03000 family)